MKKDEYIALAVSEIKNRKAKRETARELAEHIDELTEHYAGHGWHPDEAEERAVLDMGSAEKVSFEFGRLHTSAAGKIVFFFLTGFLILFAVLETVFHITIVDLFSVNLFIQEDLNTQTSNMLVQINSVLLYSVLFILSVAGYKKYKVLLKVALGAELYLMARSAFWIVLLQAFHILSCFLIPALFFLLTLTLIIIIEREESQYNGVKRTGAAFATVGIVIGTAASLFVISLFGNYAIGLLADREIGNNRLYESFDDYKQQAGLPTEVADEEMAAKINVDDYTCIFWGSGNRTWYIDSERLKPDRILPERFNDENTAYYITEKNTDFLYRVEFDDYFGDEPLTEWYIIYNYEYPQLGVDEVSKIVIYSDYKKADISDLITGDERKAVQDTVAAYSPEEYINIGEEAQCCLCCPVDWYFEGKDGVYLESGDLCISENGECFFSPFATHLESPGGLKGSWVSHGKVYKLDAETSKEICFRINNSNYGDERPVS